MYRYYKKDQKYIMEYTFDSISEFIDYLDNNSINIRIFKNEILTSDNRDYELYDFFKTKSLQEAKEFCKFGFHDNFDLLIDLKLTLEKYIKMSKKRNKQYNYYVGYSPDVKSYLEGNPLSMINKQNPMRKHIDIYYNTSILSMVNDSQIFNRGAITLSLIEILESMGFSVNLKIFAMSEWKNQIHYAKFNLKKAGERLNIQKLYFPLCNPSFFRRLVFRLREETPDLIDGWDIGYGKAADDYTIRKILNLKEDDIVICSPDEMGVLGYDIIDDANSMFDYINKITSDFVELEHVKRLKR